MHHFSPFRSAYGTTINDWKLVRKSIKVETLSLLFCIFMGFSIGAMTGPTSLSDDWPTDEMMSRGTSETFFVSIPVAFVSGLGVAVSLLDDQASSLVGVAISASLLPPAVNAGVLWVAYLFVSRDVIETCSVAAAEVSNGTIAEPLEEGSRFLGTGFFDAVFDTQDAFFDRCDGDAKQDAFYRAGLISLCVTLVNIVLIWISGMLMCRLKEVLPIKKKVFWEDLGTARKIYQSRAVLSRENYQVPQQEEEGSDENV